MPAICICHYLLLVESSDIFSIFFSTFLYLWVVKNEHVIVLLNFILKQICLMYVCRHSKVLFRNGPPAIVIEKVLCIP